ncbi:MAG: TaqI-like C-terminal specificity domain-containing protein [Candidatus Wallbacteria bacterium]|nr:TaqI-like C-terminal specificity domain-containing protein [Candidatus Wallbacteria bacterium]
MPSGAQENLFGEIEPKTISIEKSALVAGVSTATIRNWIKTGYLMSSGKGLITLDSLEHFKKEVAGKTKLIHRANKSLKDDHDHQKVTSIFLDKISKSTGECDSLGVEYERRLSESYRNKEGIYYTPKSIVDELFRLDSFIPETASFCDPCCGSGNFVMRALSLGFRPENVYAFDTDPIAVELTKKRIYERCGYESKNIMKDDFLKMATSIKNRKYDYIFTNPPWGKKIEKKVREGIAALLRAGASIDTCSLFFFACLNSLENNGTLGILLPEAFFNISSFEDARKRAQKFQIERFVDFGKPFDGLMTKAQAIVLSNNRSTPKDFVVCESGKSFSKRSLSSLTDNPKSVFNFYCSQEDAETIAHVFSIPHINLKNRAKWGIGIVTGNNAKFVKEKPADNLIPVFKGSDITENGLREPSGYIPSDMSLYQQVAPMEIYTSKEKLIYKFISSKLCFVHDVNQQFVLNSANILIPDNGFPVKMKILCGLLNSDFMNWVFMKIFNTHKVLRTDLETLPIHSQFLMDEQFNESVFLSKMNIERTADGTYRAKRYN